ncbi:MAG: hypothetical protein SFX73_34875 [Kofleriaceae bacterium]|nr:hypothetical protein [Kofleriaceae bacterium]
MGVVENAVTPPATPLVVRGLVAMAALASCAHPPSRRAQVLQSFEATVAEDLAPAGSALRRCGTVTTTYEEFLAQDSCFIEAFRSCQPAQVMGAYHGIDSGPFYWSATVVSNPGGGCEIRYYKDTRNDAFGAHAITRHRCTGTRVRDCKLVWREDHSLCRETMNAAGAPATRTCVALPPGTRWTEH